MMTEVQKRAQARTLEALRLIEGHAGRPVGLELKSRSRLHRLIGWLLARLGNPAYLDHVWTTVGSTIWRPRAVEAGPLASEAEVVLHEGVHVLQARRLTAAGVAGLYLLPQLLALPALVLALLVSPWWLLGLLCLAPLPAMGRALLEWEAYKVSVAVDAWLGPPPPWAHWAWIEGYVRKFTGPAYWFMWPFRRSLEHRFGAWARAVAEDRAVLTPYLRGARDLVLRHAQNVTQGSVLCKQARRAEDHDRG